MPTLRGWFLIALLGIGAGFALVTGTVPFLSPSHPWGEGILVVEGWLPDYGLKEARRAFERGPYRRLLVPGVPIEEGLHISVETNYAQLSAGALRAMGVPGEAIVQLACQEVSRDRTYTTARKVREWLDAHATSEPVDVFTLGVHARRTWLLYRLALGDRRRVGIICGHDRRYDEKGWWKTSSGFRTVTGEMLAYIYAKFWFSPNDVPRAHPVETSVSPGEAN